MSFFCVCMYSNDDTKALLYLHEAGWVHRDISAGNVHYYDRKGVLGDLEYAKIAGTGGIHEVKTVSA